MEIETPFAFTDHENNVWFDTTLRKAAPTRDGHGTQTLVIVERADGAYRMPLHEAMKEHGLVPLVRERDHHHEPSGPPVQ